MQDFFIKKDDVPILHLEKELNEFSSRSDLILINSGECLTTMNFTHRKEWISTDEKIANENYINSPILKHDEHSEIKLENYEIVFQIDHHTIY